MTDLRPEAEDAFRRYFDRVGSHEEAARQALRVKVVRSGTSDNLVARVHWEKLRQDELGVFLFLKPPL